MKSNWYLLIVLAIVLAFCYSCGDTSGAGKGSIASKSCDKVLATVGASNICNEEFQARLEKIPPFYRKRVATAKGKLEYLNRMIEDELFYLEALKQKLDKDPEVVAQLSQIEKSILAGKIKKTLMEESIEVSDDDVKTYFDAHQDEFMSPETVTVRHILFRVKHKATEEEAGEKEKLAKDVLAKIKSGKLSFKEAAKQFSDDKASAKRGGDLSPIKKGIKSAEFEKAVFGMEKADEISGVFRDRRGFNIVQFVEKTKPALKEFDKVEARIRRKLQQNSRKDKMDGFVANLRSRNPVVIHEDLLTDDEVGADAAAPPAALPKIGKEKPGANTDKGEKGKSK